jgi:hypothetical protein
MEGRVADSGAGVEEAMAAGALTLPPVPIVDHAPPAAGVDTLAEV